LFQKSLKPTQKSQSSKVENQEKHPEKVEINQQQEAFDQEQSRFSDFNMINDSSYVFHDEYISKLLETNVMGGSFDRSRMDKEEFKCKQQSDVSSASYDNDLMSDELMEYKSKSLVRLEEKEYLNQIITTTTTTTIKTLSDEELFVIFGNDLDLVDDTSSTSYVVEKQRHMTTTSSDENLITQNSLKINKNVYSCLANYCSSTNSAV
jgi:hypothetical protein